MTITYHPEVVQGSEEWAAMRCGLLTASEMKKIITPTLKIASNSDERAHVYEIAAQRVTGYVEPQYVSDDMLRGQTEEILARALYSEKFAPVQEVGFITRGFVTPEGLAFKIGYSPDGLVGKTGAIEAKSRRAKYQLQTIIENAVPDEHVIQVQTGLLVSGLEWIDYLSYCGGLPMVPIRALPNPDIMGAILHAAMAFETRVAERVATYQARIASDARLIPTERVIEQEMFA